VEPTGVRPPIERRTVRDHCAGQQMTDDGAPVAQHRGLSGNLEVRCVDACIELAQAGVGRETAYTLGLRLVGGLAEQDFRQGVHRSGLCRNDCKNHVHILTYEVIIRP
jgi:hypothetical protein